MNWLIVSGHAIGVSHVRAGLPCQDYGSFCTLADGQIAIGAIADGIGSAKHSETGSKLAVDEALRFMQSHDWLSKFPNRKEEVENLFYNLLQGVCRCFEEYAHQRKYNIHDLACTLLVFITTPDSFAALQVGDGFLVVRATEGDYELLFRPKKGEYANQTTAITSARVPKSYQVCLHNHTYEFICASTDGLEDLALVKLENWRPYERFFAPLERHMRSEETLANKENEVIEFLNSDRINHKTTDDKTLILCIRHEQKVIEDSKAGLAEGSPALQQVEPEITDIEPQINSEASTVTIDKNNENQPSSQSEATSEISTSMKENLEDLNLNQTSTTSST